MEKELLQRKTYYQGYADYGRNRIAVSVFGR